MDICHRFFLLARKGLAFSSPIPKSVETPRIMDLGTGTGIWPINVGEVYVSNIVFLSMF